MNFLEALQKLKIEDYAERIFNSNSHGELMHLRDYIVLAEHCEDADAFRAWFVSVVQYAEQHWNRPESIFQHILRMHLDG
jgi:hypothetical protein